MRSLLLCLFVALTGAACVSQEVKILPPSSSPAPSSEPNSDLKAPPATDTGEVVPRAEEPLTEIEKIFNAVPYTGERSMGVVEAIDYLTTFVKPSDTPVSGVVSELDSVRLRRDARQLASSARNNHIVWLPDGHGGKTTIGPGHPAFRRAWEVLPKPQLGFRLAAAEVGTALHPVGHPPYENLVLIVLDDRAGTEVALPQVLLLR